MAEKYKDVKLRRKSNDNTNNDTNSERKHFPLNKNRIINAV
ncbi:1188_t:CDS:2 [Dentiscutata heterogama]|uniref:1188_t:CDS:1 n=1 Tax=Dentiscutata heterogama TaxID=1316150 RepID=A0ACA9M6E8_9GLOM|nr:1188_t:CDS:2 [Dentiscutata heterogama]